MPLFPGFGTAPYVKQPKVLKRRGDDDHDGQTLMSPVITSWNDYDMSLGSETQPYVVSCPLRLHDVERMINQIYKTCWSACKDEQITYEIEKGGLFVDVR